MIDNDFEMDFADCLASFFDSFNSSSTENTETVKADRKKKLNAFHEESVDNNSSNRRLQRIYVYQENMILEGVLDGVICLVLRDKSRGYADKYAKKLQDLLNLSEGFFKVTVGDLYPNKKPVNLTIQFI